MDNRIYLISNLFNLKGRYQLKNNLRNTYITKSELVYRRLKKAIILGELKPREKIKIEDLRRNLGISTSPIREAMKRLEAENLLVNIPAVGTVVSDLSPEEIEEYYLIRANLESLAAKLATPFIGKDLIGQLRQLLCEMETCVQSRNYERYSVLNKRFHRLIYKSSPYKKLQQMIYDLWNVTQRFKAVFRLVPQRLSESYEEHKAMVEAIAQCNSELVERLVKEQQLKVGRYCMKLLNEQKD